MNGLEMELGASINFIRLNILDTDGQLVRDDYKVSTVPTFIMLDPAGEELWRSSGALDTNKVHEAACAD